MPAALAAISALGAGALLDEPGRLGLGVDQSCLGVGLRLGEQLVALAAAAPRISSRVRRRLPEQLPPSRAAPVMPTSAWACWRISVRCSTDRAGGLHVLGEDCAQVVEQAEQVAARHHARRRHGDAGAFSMTVVSPSTVS